MLRATPPIPPRSSAREKNIVASLNAAWKAVPRRIKLVSSKFKKNALHPTISQENVAHADELQHIFQTLKTNLSAGQAATIQQDHHIKAAEILSSKPLPIFSRLVENYSPRQFRLSASAPKTQTIARQPTAQSPVTTHLSLKDVTREEYLPPEPPPAAATHVGSDDTIRFLVFGCQGSGTDKQKRVAKLIEELIKNPTKRPAFVLVLGDNFYDSGVDSPDAEAFKTLFNDMYAALAKLNIPCYVIQGNHDQNIQKFSLESQQGVDRGINQVAHHYYLDVAEQENKYASGVNNLDQKQKLFNMPSLAYSINTDKVEIFGIDSNTYMKDYLEYCAAVENKTFDPKKNPKHAKNQVYWLEKVMAEVKQEMAANPELKNKKLMLALHHPLETPGKRFHDVDGNLYLKREDLSREAADLAERLFPHVFKKTYSNGGLIKEALQKQNLEFDLVFSAHDHAAYYFNNKTTAKPGEYKFAQATAGWGGSTIQDELSFTKRSDMGCFLNQHGVLEIECGKETLIITHAVKKDYALDAPSENIEDMRYNLKFSIDTCSPIQEFAPGINDPTEKTKILQLTRAIGRAIDEYLNNFIGPHQERNPAWASRGNVKHGKTGIRRANDLWAYISKARIESYDETIKQIYKIMHVDYKYTHDSVKEVFDFVRQRDPQKKQHSLKFLVDDELRKMGTSLQALHQDVLTRQEKPNQPEPKHSLRGLHRSTH